MTRSPGGFIFAEDPQRAAPDACLIWQAALDPGTLQMVASPVDSDHADRFDPARFRCWFAIVTDPAGREHAVLSDGYHHIRIDIEEGSLAAGRPVLLRYALQGVVGAGAEARLAPLRRLVGLYRTGRFLPALFPPDRRVERALAALRVHDALSAGASQRDIAMVLFGTERIPADWRTASDSLRSRVRRLVAEARRMAGGGYRWLLRRDGEGA
ncbi:MAG: DUF2285 domain-containing protein [Candidatus Sphingomonas phytovorans]|nr:DUF2285 domain-containing protein [Sphingomonas sp.]WEK02181.1 MAG: DUF2285 domain-containing protein [Sphingomonas sp.]